MQSTPIPDLPTLNELNARFPMMRPYVGCPDCPSDSPRILLVGESHYLPPESTVHLDAASWYASSARDLTAEERDWMDTATIYAKAMAENFANKAHSIWGNSLWALNHYGPAYPDYREAAAHVVTCNFFLRPAVEGESLEVEDLDVHYANLRFQSLLNELRPTAVVFLSRLAFTHLTVPIPVPHLAVPHPGSPWWNRASAKYENRIGREYFGQFIAQLPWCSSMGK